MKCIDLSKQFGEFKAIDNINFETNTNKLGLLGPNGSGKTTLIKLMLGLISPSSGTIELNVNILDTRVVPDHPILPGELTVDQWIRFIEKIHGPNNLGKDIQSIFQLRGEQKIKNLSAGQTRKTALLPIFYGMPKLILLDEPTNFLDIVAREKVIHLLEQYLKNNKAKLILATHRIDEMRIFSDDVMLLKEGKVVKTISTKNKKPLSYAIQVNNPDQFKNILDKNDIRFEYGSTYNEEEFNLNPSDQLWKSIDEFTLLGGEIHQFQSNDELKHTIKELIY